MDNKSAIASTASPPEPDRGQVVLTRMEQNAASPGASLARIGPTRTWPRCRVPEVSIVPARQGPARSFASIGRSQSSCTDPDGVASSGVRSDLCLVLADAAHPAEAVLSRATARQLSAGILVSWTRKESFVARLVMTWGRVVG